MSFHHTKREKEFIATVKEYYRRHKRRKLPWRQFNKAHSVDRQAYYILVSEIMLQQTQVERVIPKYEAFFRTFPTLEVLARAPLGTVLRLWQGLGYNRRAKHLHECAKILIEKYKGSFPRDHTTLMSLPGLGHYTAGAVMVFAFNTPVPFIETNIRSVYLHHFFEYDEEVKDSALMPLIERTLDQKNPRAWYYALMDYGSYIKKMYGNPNIRSKHHVRQSTFKGSDREIRGAIIRLLSIRPHTRNLILKLLKQFPDIRIDAQLAGLLKEGMILKVKTTYQLPTK
jgi:A/G-specific adenine glycosylase